MMETKELEIIPVEQAVQCRKVGNYQANEIIKPMIGAISWLYTLRGQTCEKNDLQFMASELTRSIKQRFPELSLQEIAIALDRGVKKDYGEYYGLNVITMLDWIRAYAKSPERAKYLERLTNNEKTSKPTPAETVQKTQEMTLAIFDNYRLTGKFKSAIIFCAMAYDYLHSVQVITMTDKMTAGAKEMAKKQISWLIKDKYSGDIHRTTELNIIINDAIRAKMNDKKNFEITAKSCALKLYFDELIKRNIDLRQLIQKTAKTPP